MPATWQDQSINVFKVPADDEAAGGSLVVSRDHAAAGKPFAEYVQTQAETATRQLPHLEWLNREDSTVGGQPASTLEFNWEREGTAFYLRQLLVKRAGYVLIFTLTASPDDRAHYLPTWDALVASLALRPEE